MDMAFYTISLNEFCSICSSGFAILFFAEADLQSASFIRINPDFSNKTYYQIINKTD